MYCTCAASACAGTLSADLLALNLLAHNLLALALMFMQALKMAIALSLLVVRRDNGIWYGEGEWCCIMKMKAILDVGDEILHKL